MKKLLSYIFACSILFTACKNNKTDSTETTIQQNMDEIKSSTAEQGKAGKGKIALQCNGKTYEINGVCGAVTSMGTLTIAVPDDSFPAKVFTINFTNDKMPEATSSYSIVGSVYDDKDATHVSIGYTDMRQANPMIWESDNKTGKLDFTVNGNEIKCSFSNLSLQPNTMYNKGEVAAMATVSGDLIIYKN
ncbi:MAG TPA: hypothetical protein PLJ42_04700 [Chitinophagales bacterium]|jgi:hypothetical protein|nr:hypothetical protein [Chitinophagales bacterium]MBP6154393.1 hypothetical protein [Chitinophagales bacterium]HQV77991.1 hypothetical protein [Chitinophagales bacterium]HQW78713.1 hypothetical protein [Chitinophagales bacterium]HRB18564.1 hypothetical protein [Chitinophagales bacterium]